MSKLDNILRKFQNDLKDCADIIEDEYPTLFKSGGKLVDKKKKKNKIHIKKANEGKFTEAANRAGMGVQEYAQKVLNDPNASPTLKKRANFAVQAKRWARN